MLVCALKTAEDPHNARAWLNPTEVEETCHEVNCHYLNGAVTAFFDHYKTSKVEEIQELRTNKENMQKEDLNTCNHLEAEGACGQNGTVAAGKQEAASLFGPDLVPVMLRPKETASEGRGTFESDGKDFVDKDGKRFAKLCCADRQWMKSNRENAGVEQMASNPAPAPSQTFISTDDLLDCLVNPQVTRMVAQLLLQGKSL